MSVLATQSGSSNFSNPEDKFWDIYLKGAEAEDKDHVEDWMGDTDGVLIFVRKKTVAILR
jgi:hypothetical protein